MLVMYTWNIHARESFPLDIDAYCWENDKLQLLVYLYILKINEFNKNCTIEIYNKNAIKVRCKNRATFNNYQ